MPTAEFGFGIELICLQILEKNLNLKSATQSDLARMFHESPTATAERPSFRASDTLRRTVQVRLGSETLRLPGVTAIFAVSRRQFMKHPG
jgi:hypothetical protein